MADHKEGNKLRSRGAGKPLRSRGFLSHSGAQSTGADIGEGSKNEPAQRSRGMRQASVHANGKPKDLSPKATVKPYRQEEE